ncbi:MAG: S8 family serine peptidase, partial [Anaerolineaceae bacterium]|nr:S8 family serine peptidase [Anaerolineaceae bacterium]
DTRMLVESIKRLGGTLIDQAPIDATLEIALFNLPGNLFNQVSQLAGVYSIQPLATNGGLRGEMSSQINSGNYGASNLAYTGYQDWLGSLSLNGESVTIANVDSGVDDNHPDLINNMLPCTGSSCAGSSQSNHGTHTAGIMAADGASGTLDSNGFLRGLGVAPSANLIEQLYSPTYTLADGMLTLMFQSWSNGAIVSGNSWGPSATPLGYDANTRQVDVGVRDVNPDLPGDQSLNYILSIMNGGGGTSTQGTPDEAKNIFTIGSTEMQFSSGTQQTSINDISYNSAHGPALDGRIIPHMVAPGCYVDSTNINSYQTMCGTSMSSPQVSGAVALFIEYYRNLFSIDPSPAIVKAAFLPVAHDLAGFHDADNGILGHPFDAKQGWGRLDLSAVLDPQGDVYYFDAPQVFDNTGETWQITLNIPDLSSDLRIMLAWTDAPGHGLGGTTPAWNNDLDLIVSAGGNTYLGNNFDATTGWSQAGGTADSMNNTEGVFLPASFGDQITITVSAANITSDGLPNSGDSTDQDFAIVIYSGIYQYIFPLTFSAIR